MIALVRRTNGLLFRQGGLLIRATEISQAAYQECCCPADDDGDDGADCCAPGLPTTLCAEVVTNDCITSTGGTVTFDLTQIYTNGAGTVRVWQGSGLHCPTCETWHLQIAAECDEATGNVTWYICQDSCLSGDFVCDVSPPDLSDVSSWVEIGVTDGTPCLIGTYFGVPLSSCGDGGAYDCTYALTLSEGAC